jgi:hypothetical protein
MADETEIPSYVEYQEDIANAKAPAPLPVGKYHASIVEAKPLIGVQKGTKYAAVTFLVPAAQYPADYTDGPPDGTKIIYRRVSMETTAMGAFMMSRFVKAIGAPTGRRVELADWIGREATIEVAHTMYEGQQRHEIKAVEPA